MAPVVDLQQRRWKRYEQILLDKLSSFGRQACSESTLNHALEQFWGPRGLSAPEFDDEASFARFFDWFVFDYRRTNRTRRVVERFRATLGGELSEEEHLLLDAWEDASLGLFEVTAVRPGEGGMVLTDLFTGERLEVRDEEAAERLHKYDLVFARPLRVGDGYSLSSACLVVPRSWKPALERLVWDEYARFARRYPGAGWRAFFRARAHRLNRFLVERFLDRPEPRLQTASGENLVLCRAWYDVTDPEEVAAILAGLPGFQQAAAGEDGGVWHWFKVQAVGALVLGEVRLRGGRLRLQCLARERLALGKRLLAEALGERIRHRVDEFRNPRDLVEGRLASVAPLPEDVTAAVTQFLYNYYRRWVDAPVPALGGRSPRQACATEEGRQQVAELLKHLENLEDKKKRAGQPHIEVNVIRRELGLPEEE